MDLRQSRRKHDLVSERIREILLLFHLIEFYIVINIINYLPVLFVIILYLWKVLPLYHLVFVKLIISLHCNAYVICHDGLVNMYKNKLTVLDFSTYNMSVIQYVFLHLHDCHESKLYFLSENIATTEVSVFSKGSWEDFISCSWDRFSFSSGSHYMVGDRRKGAFAKKILSTRFVLHLILKCRREVTELYNSCQ